MLFISAVTSVSNGVKVNMQGSLSFGKDVLDTLSHYMRRSYMPVPSRRSMGFSKENDVVYLVVKSMYLCRELAFCDGRLESFLNEYITFMAKTIEDVFEALIKPDPKPVLDETDSHVFLEELKSLLREIRKLLRTTNMRVTSKTEPYHWMDVIKKITAMFQESAIIFATDKIEDKKSADAPEIKKKLTQKFVIATVVVEGKYESKLCTDYNVCTKSYECTKALNTLLEGFVDLETEKVKSFIRYVAEALHDSSFYSHVSEVTANELQVILNDMAFSDSVPTKDVLMSIQKTVEERLSAVKANTHFVGGKDVELVHVILSDMDHFYAKQKTDPFHVFLSNFFDWKRLDTKFRSSIRELVTEIGEKLYDIPEQLQVKLIHEVRAFLELTVDPEK